VPWRSAGGQLERRCQPGQLLRGPGAILTSNNKYSVPYAVPQEPRAVTKRYAQARVADGGWYAWFWARQARDAGRQRAELVSAQHATRLNRIGDAEVGRDDISPNLAVERVGRFALQSTCRGTDHGIRVIAGQGPAAHTRQRLGLGSGASSWAVRQTRAAAIAPSSMKARHRVQVGER
jgi:hypothetical protein